MNIVLSMYWLPPIAKPMTPLMMARAAKFGEPAPIKPAMAARPSVMLNAGLLPM